VIQKHSQDEQTADEIASSQKEKKEKRKKKKERKRKKRCRGERPVRWKKKC
jgi:hypothetical protein